MAITIGCATLTNNASVPTRQIHIAKYSNDDHTGQVFAHLQCSPSILSAEMVARGHGYGHGNIIQ